MVIVYLVGALLTGVIGVALLLARGLGTGLEEMVGTLLFVLVTGSVLVWDQANRNKDKRG